MRVRRLIDPVGRAPVALDHLQVLLEARPGREAVVAGNHELRSGQRDRVRALRVIFGD